MNAIARRLIFVTILNDPGFGRGDAEDCCTVSARRRQDRTQPASCRPQGHQGYQTEVRHRWFCGSLVVDCEQRRSEMPGNSIVHSASYNRAVCVEVLLFPFTAVSMRWTKLTSRSPISEKS